MTSNQCPHHWIIETANGPISKGKCKLCRVEREFNNSVETWGGWTPQVSKLIKEVGQVHDWLAGPAMSQHDRLEREIAESNGLLSGLTGRR